MAQLYNAPPGTPSSIGTQVYTEYYDRKSLMDAMRETYFSPLASHRFMPHHMGKKLKCFFYVPLLDDRNINDQGLDVSGATIVDGNLYGSSKDVGTITGRLPLLSEEGGRVNRVGHTRQEREGEIAEYGIFQEFSKEALQFDNDVELYSHISRELMYGAKEIYEDLLQMDLLAAAGTVTFTGAATQDNEITAEGVDPSKVTYDDLKRLDISLTDLRCPLKTTVISGSRLEDTKTVDRGRIMFIGSELQTTVENMLDTLGNPAFVPARQYADAGNLMNNELGAVGGFRFVIVPEMMHWAGAGAAESSNPGYRSTGGNYDIFPMLCVGDESFACVGLQGSKKGKGPKYTTHVRKPGTGDVQKHDPYHRWGLASISFWHGFIALRPERIALIKTVAPV